MDMRFFILARARVYELKIHMSGTAGDFIIDILMGH